MTGCPTPSIILKDELLYSFNSTDNERHYAEELLLTKQSLPTTIYGLIVDNLPRLVIGAGGGATCIGEHTMLQAADEILIAIGDHVCSYSLTRLVLNWHLKIDPATCFGIHYNPDHDAYIGHGELTITRFDLDGKILWQQHGTDIFGDFALHPDYIEAYDFNDREHRLNYITGQS